VQLDPSVERQFAPQHTSPQNGAGFVLDGVDEEHPMYLVKSVKEPRRRATRLREFLSRDCWAAGDIV
jgi:hypothetical protein